MTSAAQVVGTTVASRYRLERVLGRGAMGTVFRAVHARLGRPLAIKILNPSSDSALVARFQREAEVLGKLHHPNVVTVVDVGEADGLHYIAMELVDGPTLGCLLDRGALAPDRAIAILRQLCDGLEHAHTHGLVHRDFKPDNVILERDGNGIERVRIVDFGIALLRDDQRDRLTELGLVLGTPHYMAPENATGQPIDHRIDLYALGVTAYEMLCGRLPFDGDGVEVARANLLQPVPPMAERAPAVIVDPLLEAFARWLMEKQPDARPQSARAARHLLDLIQRDRPAAAALLRRHDRAGVAVDAPLAVKPLSSGPIRIDRGRHKLATPAQAVPLVRGVRWQPLALIASTVAAAAAIAGWFAS